MRGSARGGYGMFGSDGLLIGCCATGGLRLEIGAVLAVLVIPLLNAGLELCTGKFYLLRREVL